LQALSLCWSPELARTVVEAASKSERLLWPCLCLQVAGQFTGAMQKGQSWPKTVCLPPGRRRAEADTDAGYAAADAAANGGTSLITWVEPAHIRPTTKAETMLNILNNSERGCFCPP
jgi:hypothetical protein